MNSSSMSKIHSDVILSITTAFLFPFPLLNPDWSSPSMSSLQSLMYDCAMGVAFAAFYFFFKVITVTSMKSLGHCLVLHMLLISCIISMRPSSLNNLSTFSGMLSTSVAFLSLISLTLFHTLPCKYKGLFHLHQLPLQLWLLGFLVY